jgi:hypothetical protein
MKKALTVFVLTLSATAFAACPAYAPYGCITLSNGNWGLIYMLFAFIILASAALFSAFGWLGVAIPAALFALFVRD